jgi:hypothetical protein
VPDGREDRWVLWFQRGSGPGWPFAGGTREEVKQVLRESRDLPEYASGPGEDEVVRWVGLPAWRGTPEQVLTAAGRADLV